MNISKKLIAVVGGIGLVAGAAGTVALQTHAQTTGTPAGIGLNSLSHLNFNQPAAAGTVSAINGNTITVTDKKTSTTYTVDASAAIIQKISAPSGGGKPTASTIGVSDIKVGDMIAVEGTVSGSSIAATKIIDGAMSAGIMRKFKGAGHTGTRGTVSAVSGNTITVTGRDGKTYTVDISGASLHKISAISASDIKVGDTLTVNGTVSGGSIAAKNVIDGTFPNKGTR